MTICPDVYRVISSVRTTSPDSIDDRMAIKIARTNVDCTKRLKSDLGSEMAQLRILCREEEIQGKQRSLHVYISINDSNPLSRVETGRNRN